MSLRLAVTYARIFTRDRPLYRFLVSFLAIVAGGHAATTTACLFNYMTPLGIRELRRHDIQTKVITSLLSFTVATQVVSHAFFLARLWSFTRSGIIRWASASLTLISTGFLVAWCVLRALEQQMHLTTAAISGTTGVVCGWLLVLSSTVVTGCSLYVLPRARPLEEEPHTRIGNIYRFLCLLVETSSLTTLDYFVLALTRTLAIRYPNATLVATWTLFLFPGLSVFSVIFALNQRPPPPLSPSSGSGGCSLSKASRRREAGMGGERSLDAVASHPAVVEMGESGVRSGIIEGRASTPVDAAAGEGGTIIYDPDNPHTWRGDAQYMFPTIRLEAAEAEDTPPRTAGERSNASGKSRMARAPSTRFGGATSSMGGAEYDEEAMAMDPTVVALNLDALNEVEATTSTWGPRQRLQDEAQEGLHSSAPSTSLSAPDSSV
ncbi:hypothetical protein JCM10213v2_003817 [Rhodosporidiobolus nylandii]